MNNKLAIVKRLREAELKAAARLSSAKDELKAVKLRFKAARKLVKAEKKSAKQLRRKLKDAVAATFVSRSKPSPAVKPKAVATKARATAKAPAGVRSTVTRKKPAAKRAVVKKPKPRGSSKARTKPAPTSMRSAAEVAKSVIERLHAPPPLLPPTPVMPPTAPAQDDKL